MATYVTDSENPGNQGSLRLFQIVAAASEPTDAEPMPKSQGQESKAAIRKRFARHLVAVMKSDGRKGVEIAQAIGISQQTLTDYRKGRSTPGVENLLLLARELKEPVEFLVGDRLRRVDSLDQLGRDLSVLLGKRRLRGLLELSEDVLCAEVDRIIGSQYEPSARSKRRA